MLVEDRLTTASRRTACRIPAPRSGASRRSAGSSARTPTPVYFVSATAFNLLGMDRWVRELPLRQLLRLVRRPPPERLRPAASGSPARSSRSRRSATTCSAHKEIVDYVSARGPGKAVFLMFDEETEALADEVGLEVAFPPAALRTGSTRRSRRRGSPTRRACRACPTSSAGRPTTTSCTALAASARDRRRPRRADAVRRLRPDDVLHRLPGRLGRARRRARRRGAQGDAPDHLPGGGDRGRHHPPRDAGRPADDRAGGLPGADALRRRLVRQRRARLDRSQRPPARAGARAHAADGRAAARRRATAATSSSTSWPTSTPARCTSASSTRASPARAR